MGKHDFDISRIIKGSSDIFANQNVANVLRNWESQVMLSSLKNTFVYTAHWSSRQRISRVVAFGVARSKAQAAECLARGAFCVGASLVPRRSSYRTFSHRFFLMCRRLLSLPLTMAGALVSCSPRPCLLCLWRVNFITGGNVPAWIRLMPWWTLCQGNEGRASQIFSKNRTHCALQGSVWGRRESAFSGGTLRGHSLRGPWSCLVTWGFLRTARGGISHVGFALEGGWVVPC